jgi:hypothetical protein
LGIPTVADRVAQEVARRYLEHFSRFQGHANGSGRLRPRPGMGYNRQRPERC